MGTSKVYGGLFLYGIPTKVRDNSYFILPTSYFDNAACAAANLATGTRLGLHET